MPAHTRHVLRINASPSELQASQLARPVMTIVPPSVHGMSSCRGALYHSPFPRTAPCVTAAITLSALAALLVLAQKCFAYLARNEFSVINSRGGHFGPAPNFQSPAPSHSTMLSATALVLLQRDRESLTHARHLTRNPIFRFSNRLQNAKLLLNGTPTLLKCLILIELILRPRYVVTAFITKSLLSRPFKRYSNSPEKLPRNTAPLSYCTYLFTP